MNNDTEIGDVLYGILDATNMGKKELFVSLCEHPVLQKASEYAAAGSPENFRFSLPYRLDRIVDGLLETVIPKKPEAQFIFRHYQFLELNFKAVIQKFEGHCCCADKSRTILQRLTRYYLTGDEIQFNNNDIYSFSYPKIVFTTHTEIVEFFDALRNLYYGRPELYLEALGKLSRIVIA